MTRKHRAGWKQQQRQAQHSPGDGPRATAHLFVRDLPEPWEGECPAASQEGGGEGAPRLMEMTTPHMERLLAWFCDACEQAGLSSAPSPRIQFVTLGKEGRALVHRVTDAQFAGRLESVSTGVGAERSLAVYQCGRAPTKLISEADRAAGARLYKWARQAGMLGYSQDELVELIATGSLTGDLAELHHQRALLQLKLEELLAAVAVDDVEGVQALCTAFPAAANLPHVDTGDLPLTLAARLNAPGAALALIQRGASLSARDSTGKTALKAARTYEATEVEAVLLQQGAHDPHAACFLIPSQGCPL